MMPVWLVDFSQRFHLYGGRMPAKEISIRDFKERLNAVFLDMAESERAAHRGSFDIAAMQRADVWEKAASLALGLPSSPEPFSETEK